MDSSLVQTGIAQDVPDAASHLLFSLQASDQLRPALARLQALVDGKTCVVGFGPALVRALGADIAGLHEMPDFSRQGVSVPVTPMALWCWLRGGDRGDLLAQARVLTEALAPAFKLEQGVETFRHGTGPNGHGRDLTGYEDGTENPQGEAAWEVAFDDSNGPGLRGSSLVAVQQWLHDFSAFDAMAPAAQDDVIGRRRSDNEELADAPASAHVKRTAQEDFDPPAFVLRRSMPWTAGARQGGLMFVAFGRSLQAFEAQMRRMAGHDDGVVDATFSISKPVSGACFWCPPMDQGRLDLRGVGL